MTFPSGELRLRAIISAGYSGVQRAALDVAIGLGIPHGGFCPEGRVSDDGPLPDCYRLQLSKDRNQFKLAARNVRASDGTLIISVIERRRARWSEVEDADRMSREVAAMCRKRDKPWLITSPEALSTDIVIRWLCDHQIEVVNVHGPREANVQNVPIYVGDSTRRQKQGKSRAYRPGIGDVVREALGARLERELPTIRANVLAHRAARKAESDHAPSGAVPAPTAPARPRDEPEPYGPPLAPRS